MNSAEIEPEVKKSATGTKFVNQSSETLPGPGVPEGSEPAALNESECTDPFSVIVQFTPGTRFRLNNTLVEILHCLTLDRLVVKECATEDVCVVQRVDLTPIVDASPTESTRRSAFATVSEEELATARTREAAVTAAIKDGELSDLNAQRLAKMFEVTSRTIRRWVARYRLCSEVTAFLDLPRGLTPGQKSLDPAVEAIIRDAVRKKLRTSGNCSVRAVRESIRADSRVIGKSAPANSTILDRIKTLQADPNNLPPAIARKLRERTQPVRGSTDISRALQEVQIDHTLVDTHIVDPWDGKSLGRPWLTIAIDTFTRVILGFLLSIEHPSRLSVALCMRHAVFPKEAWLQKLGVTAHWPMYGLMESVYTDSGPEFKSPSFEMGCRRLNIDPRRRPLKQPRYGGIIERAIGTFMRRLRLVPGNTVSEILKDRSPYPEQAAVLTLAALNIWFINEFCAYHHTEHSSLRDRHGSRKISPHEAWQQAWQTDHGLIVPSYPADPRRLFINLLPHASRRLSRDGIHIHTLEYRSLALEPYLISDARGIIRTDPRDISSVFLDLPGDAYLEVPWTNTNWPPMSLREWDEIRKHNGERAKTADNGVVRQRLEANDRLIDEEAAKGKLRARRRRARGRQRYVNSRDFDTGPLPPMPRTQLDVTASSLDSAVSFEVLE